MRYASPTDILRAVSAMYDIGVSDILNEDRNPSVVRARRAIGGLARKMTAASYPEIARAVSRTGSHATVITRCKRWRKVPKQERDDAERFVRGWLTARGLKAFDRPQVGGWQGLDFIRRMDKLAGPHPWDNQEQHAA